jgi:hypothetical protein
MGITAINGVAITSSLANTASSVSIFDNSSAAGNFFPLFVINSGSGPAQFLNFDQNYIYNPIANLLTVTNITSSGGLFGTSSWSTRSVTASLALTSSRAQTIETINNATNATFFPTFVDSANGSIGPELVYTDTDYSFNPSTNELRAGIINNNASNTFSVTADANLTVDASLTQSVWWVASLTATRSLVVNNLTTGRHVKVYIRNTNGTQRQITFSGSTTTTGHAGINMAISAGGASAITQNIAASNGTMLAHIQNFGGNIGGGLM